jgi:mRNA interferase MazF
MASPAPGEVYLIDFGMVAKTRPCVVVSREDADAPRATSIVAPFTTSSRESAYEIVIPKPRWLAKPGVINLQGLVAMGHHDLGRRLGKLGPDDFAKIKEGLRFVFDI